MTCGKSVVFSTNKTNCYDIAEILFKVVLNTINHQPPKLFDNIIALVVYQYIITQNISVFLITDTRFFHDLSTSSITCMYTGSIVDIYRYIMHKKIWYNIYLIEIAKIILFVNEIIFLCYFSIVI